MELKDKRNEKKVLYLGIDPSRLKLKGEVFHYPIIEVVARPFAEVEPDFLKCEQWSHIILTSRKAVEFFFQACARIPKLDLENKIFLLVGNATADKLKEKGSFSFFVAQKETGEGVIELIHDLKGHYFFPHSSLSRHIIVDFLKEKNVSYTECILYDTYPTKQSPPDLEPFDEIIFTSSSTVEAFLSIYKVLPKNKVLTAVGPVTSLTLRKLSG